MFSKKSKFNCFKLFLKVFINRHLFCNTSSSLQQKLVCTKSETLEGYE
jgi:hypothetical protein